MAEFTALCEWSLAACFQTGSRGVPPLSVSGVWDRGVAGVELGARPCAVASGRLLLLVNGSDDSGRWSSRRISDFACRSRCSCARWPWLPAQKSFRTGDTDGLELPCLRADWACMYSAPPAKASTASGTWPAGCNFSSFSGCSPAPAFQAGTWPCVCGRFGLALTFTEAVFGGFGRSFGSVGSTRGLGRAKREGSGGGAGGCWGTCARWQAWMSLRAKGCLEIGRAHV